jgi:mono/diheme cytochrome c family protein
VQAQIDRGVWLYGQRCAACHGAGGEGSASAPPVIGEGSLPLDPPPGARLRRVRFQSAMDLGLFIKDNMPPNGAHLPPQDVACVLAWLLQQHGRTPTEPISPATAGAIRR